MYIYIHHSVIKFLVDVFLDGSMQTLFKVSAIPYK